MTPVAGPRNPNTKTGFFFPVVAFHRIGVRNCPPTLFGAPDLGSAEVRAKKTMTATDVTGFDAIFSTGFFATFSRF